MKAELVIRRSSSHEPSSQHFSLIRVARLPHFNRTDATLHQIFMLWAASYSLETNLTLSTIYLVQKYTHTEKTQTQNNGVFLGLLEIINDAFNSNILSNILC